MSKRREGQYKAEKEAMREFQGLDVIEATVPLLLIPNQDDVESSIQGDVYSCALARTCERMFSSTAVIIFRTIAYVDLPDENNERRVYKFSITPKTKRLIVQFDLTGEFPPGGFWLLAVRKHQQYAVQKKAREKFKKDHPDYRPNRVKREARMVGRGKDGQIQTIEGVRNGKGMVHFIKTKKKGN